MKRIYLDGRVNSSLDWSAAENEALACKEEILWDLDLGLFDSLKRGLEDQTQFLSLSLSLEHFRDTLWKQFKERTHSVCLYNGSVDFSKEFRWDDKQWVNCAHWLQSQGEKEVNRLTLEKHPEGQQLLRLFCRDTCVEYIQLLANRMPDTMNVSVILKSNGFSYVQEAQLFHPERYERLFVLKEGELIKETTKAQVAVLLPPMDMCRETHYSGLQKAFETLIAKDIPFRIIPENHLITEWDGLDFLLVSPTGLSSAGKRKLQGFAAAAGSVISLGSKIGLPNEMDFENFGN